MSLFRHNTANLIFWGCCTGLRPHTFRCRGRRLENHTIYIYSHPPIPVSALCPPHPSLHLLSYSWSFCRSGRTLLLHSSCQPGVPSPPLVRQLLTPLLSLVESQLQLRLCLHSRSIEGKVSMTPPPQQLDPFSRLLLRPVLHHFLVHFTLAWGHGPSLLNISLLQPLPFYLSCYKEPSRLRILGTGLRLPLC